MRVLHHFSWQTPLMVLSAKGYWSRHRSSYSSSLLIEIFETTFITRYILPALQHLLDNQERNIRFEFSPTDLADNHKRLSGLNGIITIFQHQMDDGANVGFDEVKRQSMAGDHYLGDTMLLDLHTMGNIWFIANFCMLMGSVVGNSVDYITLLIPL
ncbi:hypothetical protein EDC96DRAFT_572594 [Choanephora cucurbitarum]|nr:hypothetical protein EDC96DRAFT_572594 [Choanephora cucurbitarum]